MTQKTISNFKTEFYSKGPKQNYIIEKTVVCPADNVWSLNLLGLKDFEPENIRTSRYALVAIDNLSKI